MSGFRETRELLLLANDAGDIDDEEFLLLYDLNTSKNLDYPYWSYDPFQLEAVDESECWTEFRFRKTDIHRLKAALRIPDVFRTYNRLAVNGTEALCIFLKRFSYPCRYSDMISRFGRSVPDLSIISNAMMDHIYDTFSHLLTAFDLPFLQRGELERYCVAVSNNGAALDNCFGFVDGTVRPISRPGRDQRVVYNGHKKVHSLKFQSIVIPNGLIANMFGPMEGRRHDSTMLRMSNIMPQLQQYAFDLQGRPLCIYGDPAYPLRVNLQAPFHNPVTAEQKAFNRSMSQVRVSVEWLFNDIINWFKFLDFKRNTKIGLSAIGKMYLTCALLTNARTCLYGNLTSDYFNCEPPHLEDYFI